MTNNDAIRWCAQHRARVEWGSPIVVITAYGGKQKCTAADEGFLAAVMRARAMLDAGAKRLEVRS